jgi:hypothetical protein
MGKLSPAEVLRLRATSAVSLDQSVRRSAQDDGFVGGLEYNCLNMQKTRKIRKVTALRMTGFIGGLEYNCLNMQKTRKDRKSHRLSG